MQQNGEVHGVINHDFDLNFDSLIDSEFRVNGTNTHFFITTNEGVLVKHSEVRITSPSDSLTKAEFSTGDYPLTEELDTQETRDFNASFMPVFRDLNSTVSTAIVGYTKQGHDYLAAVSIMRSRNYIADEHGQVFDDQFLISQVTDKESFVSSITDRSQITYNLLIWASIFAAITIILIFLSAFILSKVVNRALRPIRHLNRKVSSMLNTD